MPFSKKPTSLLTAWPISPCFRYIRLLHYCLLLDSALILARYMFYFMCVSHSMFWSHLCLTPCVYPTPYIYFTQCVSPFICLSPCTFHPICLPLHVFFTPCFLFHVSHSVCMAPSYVFPLRMCVPLRIHVPLQVCIPLHIMSHSMYIPLISKRTQLRETHGWDGIWYCGSVIPSLATGEMNLVWQKGDFIFHGWKGFWNKERALWSERICDRNINWNCFSSVYFSY